MKDRYFFTLLAAVLIGVSALLGAACNSLTSPAHDPSAVAAASDLGARTLEMVRLSASEDYAPHAEAVSALSTELRAVAAEQTRRARNKTGSKQWAAQADLVDAYFALWRHAGTPRGTLAERHAEIIAEGFASLLRLENALPNADFGMRSAE